MVTHYDRLIPLRYHTREIVLGIEVCVQTLYLRRSSATYAEAFYSLKRSYVGKSGIKELSKRLVFASVFMEAVMPYIRDKLEKRDTKVTRLLIRLANLLMFIYAFRYLVTQSRFFKPYLHLFNIVIRRQNAFESRIDEKKSLVWRILS
jgi:hypothetical protein